MTDLPRPARVLAIGAHPDDIEFGCGATLAKWCDAGSEVHLLVLTDGSKGSWNPDERLDRLVAARALEQQHAADAIGARSTRDLRMVDGELEPTLAARAAVCEVLRALRPDTVLGHDPWKRYRLHPDHRAAGWLTLDAIVAARDPHFFPEQPLAPHRPTHLLLFEAEVVDHLEHVTATHVDRKIDALLCHRSQWRSTLGIEDDAGVAAFRARLHEEAVGTANGSGRPAEAFKHLAEL